MAGIDGRRRVPLRGFFAAFALTVGVAAPALVAAGDTTGWAPDDPTDEPGVAALAPIDPALVPLDPARFMDTRVGGATVDGTYRNIGPWPGGSIFTVQIAGRGAVPADAVGAVMYVSAVDPQGWGFLSVDQCSQHHLGVSHASREESRHHNRRRSRNRTGYSSHLCARRGACRGQLTDASRT